MGSAIDEAWNELNRSEGVKKRVYVMRVEELLNGSKYSVSKPVQGTFGTRKSNQTKKRTEDLSFAGREAKVLGSPGSAFISVQDTCPSKLVDGTEDGTIASRVPQEQSVHDVAKTLLKRWLKNKNGTTDSNVSIRKIAMQSLSRDLSAVVKQIGYTTTPTLSEPSSGDPLESPASFLEDLMTLLMDDLAKMVFRGLADPVEACREASICATTLFMEHVPDVTPHLAYLFPVLMARGVPAGNLYDQTLELFVHNNDDHEAYKRGRAMERQDQQIPLVQHVTEGSEELRLSLCRMVGRMLVELMRRGTIGVLRPYLDDTILFLVSQSRDPYSTVKVEALLIITKLALHPHLELGMKFYAMGLSRAILPHLRHRHVKVRLAAIEALWSVVKVPDRAKVKGAGTSAIVDLVGFREDNVLPVAAFYGRGDTTVNFLAELTTDRNVSVRVKTTAMLGDWLVFLPDRYDHQTRLLPYVLNAIADEAKAVSATAIETLSKCGAEYEREHQDDIIERRQFGIDGDSRANHSKPLPRPFSGRPRIGDRLYVRSNTRRFLMPLLAELSNWISQTRLQSAMLLRTLIVYCEEHLTVEAHKLIPHLQRALHLAVSAKDKVLEDVLLECCELVGRFVVPESYLPHMLPRIREEPEVNPAGNRSTLLAILSKLVEGCVPKVLVVHTPEIVDAVTANNADVAGEASPVRWATIKVLLAVVSSLENCGRLAAEEAAFAGTGRLGSMERPIQSIIAYLLACRSLGDLPLEINDCFSSFARICGAGDAKAFVNSHARKLVESICEDYPIGPMWNRACSPHLMLEALFSVCPEAPRTCPEILPYLISLSEKIVDKLSNFAEIFQEEVLTTLVGAFVLRTIHVWQYVGETTETIENTYNVAMEEYARRVLDLGLNTCWGSTPSLRYWKIEIMGAFVESKSLHKFMSATPSEAAATAIGMMRTVLELLQCLQISSEEICKAFAVVSRILRSGFVGPKSCTCTLKLVPFSQRGRVDLSVPLEDQMEISRVFSQAYAAVLTRLDDDNNSVRLCTTRVLGDFLPFLQPDISGTQQPYSETGGEAAGKTPSKSVPYTTEIKRTRLLFGNFVHNCITHAILMTSNLEDTGELDTVLRRTACLDPGTFTAVISRVSEGSSLNRPARQLLSDLADHASLLVTFQSLRLRVPSLVENT